MPGWPFQAEEEVQITRQTLLRVLLRSTRYAKHNHQGTK
jgi:hypothetical protein